MKLKILAFVAVMAMSVTCSGIAVASEVKPGWLICNPTTPANVGALTVRWTQGKDDEGKTRNTIYFVDANSDYHKSKEAFVYDGKGLWESYCQPTGADDWRINYCSNAGEVSFFNGHTLVKSRIEFRCRNEKPIEQGE